MFRAAIRRLLGKLAARREDSRRLDFSASQSDTISTSETAGDLDVVGPLATPPQQTNPPIPSRVIEILEDIGTYELIKQHISALNNTNLDVHCFAASALRDIGCEAVEPLTVALKHGDQVLRERSAQILGDIGNPGAVPPLTIAVTDSSEDVRRAVIMALGKIGTADVVEPLVGALADVAPRVRCFAASALGDVGDPRAITPLMTSLSDEHGIVRAKAAYNLGRLNATDAVVPLIAALKDPERCVQTSAVLALGLIGDARAVAPLIEVIRPLRDSINMLEPVIFPDEVPLALSAIGQEAVPTLIAALKHPDHDVREVSAYVLGAVGDPRAVPALVKLLESGQPRDQSSAASALGNIRDSRATGPLTVALENGTEWLCHRAKAVLWSRAKR